MTCDTGEQVEAEEAWLALAGSGWLSPLLVPRETPPSASHFHSPTYTDSYFRAHLFFPSSTSTPTQWLQARPPLPETSPQQSQIPLVFLTSVPLNC